MPPPIVLAGPFVSLTDIVCDDPSIPGRDSRPGLPVRHGCPHGLFHTRPMAEELQNPTSVIA